MSAVRARRVVAGAVREFQPDVLLVYNTYLFEYLATTGVVARRGIPVFLEAEDLPLARGREWGNLKPRLDQACWKPMLARASGFTAVNEDILRLFPGDKPSLLLPGIVDAQLRGVAEQRRPPFTGGTRSLGYFGGLTEEKGVGVLLEVLPRLPESWVVVVAGGGPLAGRFEEAQQKFPGRMRFLGIPSKEDLYREMCACDCTLVPPERIGGGGIGVFPFKLFEYAVAGTHVIAPHLKPLEGSPLAFVQRWDGQSGTLPDVLASAPRDFAAEAAPRAAAIEEILARYSVPGVGVEMTKLFACGLEGRLTGGEAR